jgi:regulator of replication initiation timing
MTYFAVSGLCLAALVGSAIYENHRMKKEEKKLRRVLQDMQRDFGTGPSGL